ncbi:MAG: type III pantothenate kinase [Nitrospirota bacterium]|nr:type III pantothenate kinase [Nitrospirota bacterium]
MLLTIDIGNSQIVWGIFDKNTLVSSWRIATDSTKTADEYGILFLSLMNTQQIQPKDLIGTIISSVVPPVTHIFNQVVETFFHHTPLIVTSDYPFGLTLEYPLPDEIGTDRLVNAAGAYAQYHTGLVIVDFGTATTFCTVTKSGAYLGGAIAPGLKSSANSLHLLTAKLPSVDLVKPKQVIGTDTVSSMQSGLIFGYTGLVDELVTRIQEEVGHTLLVIATGGLASVIGPISRTIQEIRPFLTLEGLELLFRRKRSH